MKLAAITNDPIPFEDAIKLTPAQQKEIALAVPDGDFRPILGPDGNRLHLGKGQTGYADAGFVNPYSTGFHNSYIGSPLGNGPFEIPPEIRAQGTEAMTNYVNKHKQLGNASLKFELPGGANPLFAGQLDLAKQIMDSLGSTEPKNSLLPITHIGSIGGDDSIVTPRLVTADYLGLDKIPGSFKAIVDYYNNEAEKITRATDPSKSARGLGMSQNLRRRYGNAIDQFLVRNPYNGEMYQTGDLFLTPDKSTNKLTQESLHNILFDPSTLRPKAFDPFFFHTNQNGQAHTAGIPSYASRPGYNTQDMYDFARKWYGITSASKSGSKSVSSPEAAVKLRALIGQLGNLMKKGDPEAVRKFLENTDTSHNVTLAVLDSLLSRKPAGFFDSKDPLSLLGDTGVLAEKVNKRLFHPTAENIMPGTLLDRIMRFKNRK